jgi:hypothetical protein
MCCEEPLFRTPKQSYSELLLQTCVAKSPCSGPQTCVSRGPCSGPLMIPCMYVCMFRCVCMYVCMYVDMYVFNVCRYVCMYVNTVAADICCEGPLFRTPSAAHVFRSCPEQGLLYGLVQEPTCSFLLQGPLMCVKVVLNKGCSTVLCKSSHV